MTTSATLAAAAKIAKPKAKKVSHAKTEQAALPLPAQADPEFGMMKPDQITIAKQVRTEFDDSLMLDLAEDIAQRGVIEPLVVRRDGDEFVLVAGERRLRAAMMCGLAAVPVVIHQISAEEHAMVQLAENIQRADLTLQEETAAIAKLYEKHQSVVLVGKAVHKSVPWVSKRLSLSRGLGTYAAGLMADGVTEDIELLQAVDKLDKATPGSNSAWALCEKIRKGEAGRTEARDWLKRATEDKKQATEAKKPKELTKEEQAKRLAELEVQPSQAFRYWLNHSHPWIAADYIKILASNLADDKTGLLHQLEVIDEMSRNLETRRTALLDKVRGECHVVAKRTGDLIQHQAFVNYQQNIDNGNS
jgi:ParB/RepB/Spo0J family partition protein